MALNPSQSKEMDDKRQMLSFVDNQDRATSIQDAIANGTTGSLGDESKALLKTLAHANTPSVAYLDTPRLHNNKCNELM